MAHHIEWVERSGPAANARRKLPPVITRYFAYVRKLLAKDPAPPKLHSLRLETKRLRYTLELFRPCYGPGLETRLAELRELQQLLGEMNDCAATARHVSNMKKADMKKSPQRERIQKFLGDRAERKARDFRKQWTEVFDAPGRERWWAGYLAREARAPGRIK